jgi:hypothetical protein
MTNLRPFTHRIYSDFSGDDGDPRTPGASRTLCVAWVISAEDDVWHNQGVVLDIKKVIGCQRDAELKYRSLKRHPRKKDTLALISQAKIEIILAPVLTERIRQEDLKDPATKGLVNLIHYFPVGPFVEVCAKRHPDVYFQLVFDEVGWAA